MSLIKPIQIGSLKLPSNLIQAPLAGYSCAPFRVLAHQHGQPGFCTTEMMSAKDLIHRKSPLQRYTWRDPREGILSYQLSGNQPDELAKATEIVSELGADIIDLNAGCPVHKIRSKGYGSALLRNSEQLSACLKAMKNNTDKLVSVKIRVAGEIHDHIDMEIADAIEQSGIDFMTVHGRHWTERYERPSRVDSIAAIKKRVSIPVFANGDVSDANSVKSIFSATGCDGLMIGRASVGRPWLFAQLRAECNNKPFNQPSFSEIGTYFWEHIEGLISLENEVIGLLEARKFAKYYSRNLANSEEFNRIFQTLTEKNAIKDCITQFFDQTY